MWKSLRNRDSECIARKALEKINKGKPPHLWQRHIAISCRCKKCMPHYA